MSFHSETCLGFLQKYGQVLYVVCKFTILYFGFRRIGLQAQLKAKYAEYGK
jgi:hypothetical protein